MDASPKKPGSRNRPLTIALAASLAVHLAAIPFLRVAAIAHSPPPSIVHIDRATPKPHFVPPPVPTPPPRIVKVVRPPKPRPHVVAAIPPHVLARTADAPPQAHAFEPARHIGTPSDGDAKTGTPSSGEPGPATGAPIGEQPTAPPSFEPAAAPVETPACAAAPRDAHVLQAITPDRPAIAEQEDATGHVEIRVDLAATGSVESASVYKSSGNAALDGAALEAAKRATYAPATDGCRPIAGSYVYTVDYSD